MARLIVQISDCHLVAGDVLKPDVFPAANLRRGLELIASSGLRPELYLLSGDLADTGDPDCYRLLGDLVGEAAATSGSEVLYLPGNHDDRHNLAEVLLADGPAREAGLAGRPINQVVYVGGLRVVALDSVIPGQEAGELSDETLAFLAGALAEPAPEGSIVALHHPPIETPIAPMARLRLRNAKSLSALLEESDAFLVCCGHNHQAMSGTFGGLPVWVAPSSAYHADSLARERFTPVPGGALSLLDVDAGAARLSIVVL